jgi:hypothetical protein
MFFALQPGIRPGSPPHVSSAVKVLQHQAGLQGLIAKDSNPSLQAFQINLHLGDAEKRQASIRLPSSDDSEE